MTAKRTYIIGTSGYSFDDWVGTFYPDGTDKRDMFSLYARHFAAVEVNYTFYRLPAPRTMESIVRRSGPDFRVWIKANQSTTHEGDRSTAPEFLKGIQPVADSGKLAGVLLQFPQRFHRTPSNRQYLAGVLGDFGSVPLAVEFRHFTWDHDSVLAGLRERNVTLVVPDVPNLPGLYRRPATATGDVGYLRLHSRDAGKWYASEGTADRYDYNYSDQEMAELLKEWDNLDAPLGHVYAFFNNCHRGQAARNAEQMRRILGQV
jgi:uncharacterized protein YecE (DUF72 family)